MTHVQGRQTNPLTLPSSPPPLPTLLHYLSSLFSLAFIIRGPLETRPLTLVAMFGLGRRKSTTSLESGPGAEEFERIRFQWVEACKKNNVQVRKPRWTRRIHPPPLIQALFVLVVVRVHPSPLPLGLLSPHLPADPSGSDARWPA